VTSNYAANAETEILLTAETDKIFKYFQVGLDFSEFFLCMSSISLNFKNLKKSHKSYVTVTDLSKILGGKTRILGEKGAKK